MFQQNKTFFLESKTLLVKLAKRDLYDELENSILNAKNFFKKDKIKMKHVMLKK